jgi:hypothetical protein
MFMRWFRRQISIGFCVFVLSTTHSPTQDLSRRPIGPSLLGAIEHNESGGGRLQVHNDNPNVAKIHEYGRIEWHGDTAQLIAGGSWPLHLAALTLSSCLGISVSAEDPRYLWLGDLLDVTAPKFAANHPNQHAYAAKPGKVAVSFEVGRDGLPIDTTKLLEDAVDQVNEQQPWHFRLQHDVRQGHGFFVFAPTATHNESGQLIQINSWLDQRITIRPTTAPIDAISNTFAESLTSKTGYHFSCCHDFDMESVVSVKTIHFGAADQIARLVLEDLMIADPDGGSYRLVCEPMDKRFCFIGVEPTEHRIPRTAPQSGVCAADGYDPY